MKRILLILVISISLMSYGKSINKKQLQNRNGVFYEVNQLIPYTGKKVYYYKNGQIQIKAKFKDGKIEDVISYSKSGSILVKTNDRYGKIENKFSYYENNPILGTVKFKDDKIKRELIFDYKNGQIEYEINFEEGRIVYLFK
ncbi:MULTISPECIES: hypothetical protein [Psychrilyobacter]|uniref:Toxin-antitoxin system YwqK family antitoxin n=1 Tax=Psychrilyobacter piezotolerans TaxID=2293438 RepID=A0ABX9KD64_9FUSO|nr:MULTISPECIES: hypothetical protein [Psychrilyobacter]NDI79316.1 hypothetical protein [Psychrilyobacter piezotolerans]RDE58753.1 hypothetical protein DV867_15700 [Psychrilyobacter sp. S5]REI39213.1 hypothetical protein DYH56_15700 [Psychrilyobacter piezotolerans]